MLAVYSTLDFRSRQTVSGCSECHVPTKKAEAETNPRVPKAGANVRRASDAPAAEEKGARAPHSLTPMPELVVKVSSSENSGGSITVVIGKNVSKRATERNRLRRRLRAIVKEIPVLRGKNTVVIARPGALTLPFPLLKSEFERRVRAEK